MSRRGLSEIFPIVNADVGPTWTFLGFVVLGIAGITFSVRFTPETKGKTLERLEKNFRTEYA